ncbi:MAG TPA: TIM barrel protein [Rhizomicrobium sp.]|jgi:sugar phosphate isomerase/epimerase
MDMDDLLAKPAPDRRLFLAAAASTLAAPALAQPVGAPTKSGLLAYSGQLQWLRTPQDVARAVVDIGLERLDLTVRPYPGHIDPAKVKTDLPAFVNGLKAEGIAVPMITTAITDADAAAEAILATAAGAGITYYVWGGFTYDQTKPLAPQLDALKPRAEKLARLNERYKIKGLYHPLAGVANVGSAFFDILEILRVCDPRFVGIFYDTAALLQPLRDVFVLHMRLGAPYIGGVVIKDGAVTLDLPVYDEGFFQGGRIAPNNAGDNTGGDGGDLYAIGGGGIPLPYHFHPSRVGMGMIDVALVGKTLKEIGFDGPIETRVDWPLGGAETGADKISLPRQVVIGQLKHDRLTVEHGFVAAGWNIDVALPAFMRRGAAGGQRPASRGARE